ncbi:MAG TPA: hypothetical protein VHY37_07205 [Tepidisphaeraceae bacterium]|nr:hypothetical protein [Tepidisphaeraceae bacterium]
MPALLTLRLILKHYIPVTSRTAFRMISDGRFPKADIQFGRSMRMWRKEAVERWIAQESARRDPKPKR